MNKGHPFTEENGWDKLQTQEYADLTIQYVRNENYRKNPSDPKPAVAWYVKFKGRYYGDMLVIDNEKLKQDQTNSQAMKDAVILLQDQANRTIDKLIEEDEARNKKKKDEK